MSDMTETQEQYCYRHTSRTTLLSCSVCERAACIDCIVSAPVGVKCRSCLNQAIPDDLRLSYLNIFLTVTASALLSMNTGILVAWVIYSSAAAFQLLGGFSSFLLGFIIGSMMYLAAFFNAIVINYMTKRKISVLLAYRQRIAIASIFIAPVAFWLFGNFVGWHSLDWSWFINIRILLYLAIGTFFGIGLIRRTVR